MSSLQTVGTLIRTLKVRVDRLNAAAAGLKLPDLEQTEWYQLMTQKLLPQLSDNSYLVVAVVGGTNIGKSVVFNHLCNGKISATSPLASGTKHPTCVVPEDWANQESLEEIFSEFRVVSSDDEADALQASAEDLLFWRAGVESPENLFLLDTPDIDSDAEVNWLRADKVRRSADVLIAVLTQQKYNDAAVKKFFRIAAEEGKAVLVVFNQCLLPEDEPYWPIWLETFCRETGVQPEYVYLAPHDRRAAEANLLPFFTRAWPLPEGEAVLDESPRDLMRDLSTMRFEEIKLRTLSGAIHLLSDPAQGVPGYLEDIRRRSGVHGDAWKRLTERLSDISVAWPTVPNRIVIEEMRQWWRGQRTGWEANVHGFYDTLGYGLMWPIRQAQKLAGEPGPDWREQYREQEWQTIQQQLTVLFERLESLAWHGNPVLAPRLRDLLGGQSREILLADLKRVHAESAVDEQLAKLVKQQMQLFREQRGDWFKLLKRLDSVSAAARPAITVVLFATGFGPVGNAFMPMVADTALQAALNVAGDVTAGTVTAAVGDTALTSGASSGVRFLEAWFHQLHRLFVVERQTWFLAQLQERLWGTLLDDLQSAADLPGQLVYRQVEETLREVSVLKLEPDAE